MLQQSKLDYQTRKTTSTSASSASLGKPPAGGHSFHKMCLLVVASLALIFPTVSSAFPPGHSSNLLLDPGFESGTLNFPFSSAYLGTVALDYGVAHSGNASLRLTATEDNASTLPWFKSSKAAITTVDGEESFVLSAWVRSEPAGLPVGLWIFCLDSDYDYIAHARQNFSPGSDWQPVSFSYTCPAAASTVSVRLQVDTAGAVAWWDDLRFDRVFEPGSNLLGNGGFETGLLMAPFENAVRGILEIDENEVLAGRYSLRMDATDATRHAHTVPYHKSSKAAVVALPPTGAAMTFSAWAKADVDNVRIRLWIYCLDEEYEIDGDVGRRGHYASSDWQRFSVSHACPAGSRFASVRLELLDPLHTVWWDELRLQEDPRVSNLLIDPGFETKETVLPFVTATRATLSLDTSTALTGSTSLKMVASDDEAFTRPYAGSSSSAVTSLGEEATSLRFVAWAKADTPAVPVRLWVFCLDENYNYESYGFLNATVPTDWKRLVLEHECAAEDRFASVRLDVVEGGRTIWWDALEFSENPGTFEAFPLVHSSNLLLDPGFESGTLKRPFSSAYRGTVALDSEVAHSGVASLRMTATADSAFTFPWQNKPTAALATVNGEESFVFSGWVRSESAGTPVEMWIFCLGPNYELTSARDFRTFDADLDWQPATLSTTCPLNTSFASVRLQVNTAGTTAWWDDLRFDRVFEPGSNLLSNGGFETGLLMAPFQEASGGTLELDESTVLTGQYALRMESTEISALTMPHHLSSKAAVVALPPTGSTMTFSAWAKAEVGNVETRLSILCLDEDYEIVGDHGLQIDDASTDWQKFSVSHFCPTESRFASLRLEVADPSSTVWWDELRLQAGPRPSNLLTDPGFETNRRFSPFVNVYNGTMFFDKSIALTGSTSLKLVALGDDAVALPHFTDTAASVAPLGEEATPLRFVAWAKADEEVLIRMWIYCLDENYDHMTYPRGLLEETATTDWTRFVLEHECPAEADFASVLIVVDSSGRTVWWDSLEFSEIYGAFDDFPDPPAPYTQVAGSDGDWLSSTTWLNGQIPGDGAVVHIPDGRTVTVNRQEAARHKFIRVDGNLLMATSEDTRLLVETLYVGPTGSFLIGGPENRLLDDKTAEVVFTSSGAFDLTWDPGQVSRGLISEGTVNLYGATKTSSVTMTRDAYVGDTTLTVDVDLEATGANWLPGDEIVLTGTYFRRGEESREEKRTIQSVVGDQIMLTEGLTFDHIRASDTFALHVANLTRNVVLRSETASLPADEDTLIPPCEQLLHVNRGHVMLRNSDVDIHHAAFIDLGRTDKTCPLDDIIVDIEQGQETYDCSSSEATYPAEQKLTGTVSRPDPSEVMNPRGRYPLHFHLNGIGEPVPEMPPSQVHDSVVVGTPGWGFVNHSSHVDFTRNVSYDFAGAGFVTEAGDELGNFTENLAIRGTGTGTGKYRKARLVYQNCERPQPLSDFGFSGDGFWFQGPAIQALRNVANSCHGAGMVWFTTGAPDVTDIDPLDSRNNYVGFPDSALEPTYGLRSGFCSFEGRHWDHAHDELVISDLPILECDGLESYGNFIGFRLRFNNRDNIDWYRDPPFAYNEDLRENTKGEESGIPEGESDPSCEVGEASGSTYAVEGAATSAVRMREKISNLILWNNEQAFRSRYSSKTDFKNVTAVNRLIYSDKVRNNSGGELNAYVSDTTIDNITVDGYTIANWIYGRGLSDVITPSPNYLNYVMTETYVPPDPDLDPDMQAVCPDVEPLPAIAIGSTAVQLSWNRGPEHKRYLVRYWVKGEDYVEFVTLDLPDPPSEPLPTPLTLTLMNLDPETTYNYQVAAGCEELPSEFWRPLKDNLESVKTKP